MRNKLNIIIILLGSLLFSCAGDSMKDDAISTSNTESLKIEKDEPKEISLTLEEQIVELTTEQKEAFQLRAIQKFKDFTDYVKIISNPDVADDLKNHSILLTKELFSLNTNSETDSTLQVKYNETTLPLYLKLLESKTKIVNMIPKEVSFTKELQMDSTGTNYSGKMTTLILINGKKTTKNIEVHLVEILKQFGDSSQTITEIRLGNIY